MKKEEKMTYISLACSARCSGSCVMKGGIPIIHDIRAWEKRWKGIPQGSIKRVMCFWVNLSPLSGAEKKDFRYGWIIEGVENITLLFGLFSLACQLIKNSYLFRKMMDSEPLETLLGKKKTGNLEYYGLRRSKYRYYGILDQFTTFYSSSFWNLKILNDSSWWCGFIYPPLICFFQPHRNENSTFEYVLMRGFILWTATDLETLMQNSRKQMWEYYPPSLFCRRGRFFLIMSSEV